MISYVKKRWYSPCGYKDILKVALPLIFSMGSVSIQQFIDRMFLAWYSPEAIAAVTPAGLLSFTLVCVVLGTVTYTSSFVAQYFGSGNKKRIGPAVWQGIYIALIGGIILLAPILFSDAMFRFFGHEPAVRELESVYFKILCIGAAPSLISSAISCLYTGLGKTWTVMWVNMVATLVNGILDYLLIFGNFGLPEMGIAGAAIATVCAFIVSMIIFIIMFLSPRNDREFNTKKSWHFNPELFKRILRFGLPSGIHFFLDIAGFTLFMFILGRLGTVYLAASNIAFNINSIAFMPMIGVGIAVSIMVGQYIGGNEPEKAAYITESGFHIAFVYMGLIAVSYVTLPGLYLFPFEANNSFGDFETIKKVTVILLRFVAFYSLFDSFYMIFSSAIKGAGDTHFVMKVIGSASIFILVIPSYITVFHLHKGIYTVWAIGTFYISLLGVISYLRYRNGKWKTMQVIEKASPVIPHCVPEDPVTGAEI